MKRHLHVCLLAVVNCAVIERLQRINLCGHYASVKILDCDQVIDPGFSKKPCYLCILVDSPGFKTERITEEKDEVDGAASWKKNVR